MIWTTAADGTDVDDPTLVQFEDGALLTASATDGDISGDAKAVGTAQSPTWRWYRGGTLITGDDAEDNTYTVTDDDEGSRLRVEVTYRVGDNTNQTASLTSDYPVLESRDNNAAPSFASTSLAWELNEGEKGMAVGAPVTATDDGPGKLNYTLGGTDVAKFKIDQKTGRITTEVDLNYEVVTEETNNCGENRTCVVMVTATDSAGMASDPVATVTINIQNLNDEKPAFGEVASNDTPPANVMSADVDENVAGEALNVASYAATDPEAASATWSLSGADAGDFNISSGGVLTFGSPPDFEDAADADTDTNNIYEVTVEADDGTDSATLDVRVTVTNVDEVVSAVVQRYDTNGTPGIQISELLDAVDHFFDPEIVLGFTDLLDVIDAFFQR